MDFNGTSTSVYKLPTLSNLRKFFLDTLPAKNMEYFIFQRFLCILWCVWGISLFDLHSYKQILLLGN